MMTLTVALAGAAAATTDLMSSSTPFQSPALARPRLITMSTSFAPWATASLASAALISELLAPRGKPMTVQTRTSEPASSRAQRGTQVGFTHTEAKPYFFASMQSSRTWSAVPMALRRVWSIVLARVALVHSTGMSVSFAFISPPPSGPGRLVGRAGRGRPGAISRSSGRGTRGAS